MDSVFIWAQIIGFSAMALQIFAMQIKKPRLVILTHSPACLLWSVQFFLLGAYIGAFINLFASFKDLALSQAAKKYVPIIIATFLITAVTIGILKLQYWYDALPVLSTIIINLALLSRNNRPLIARATIACQLPWMSYNWIVGSWAGLACAILVIASSLIGMYRHEKWELGNCYKSFLPNVGRSLFSFNTPQPHH